MPTGAMHSFYWAGSADPPPGGLGDSTASYIPWQAAVLTIPSGFGAFQALWDRLVALVRTR